MSEAPIAPEIQALRKRCKRYRRMTLFSLLAVIALAFAPALYHHALAFSLYGIALFGFLAIVGNLLLAHYQSKLAAHPASGITR